MTYKDDLDIIKAAEGDSSKMTLNAITELDNKGMLGRYSDGGSGSSDIPYDVIFTSGNDVSDGNAMEIIRHPDELSNPHTWNAALYTVSGAHDVYYPCKYINGRLYVFKGQNTGSCRREQYVADSKSGGVPSSWDDVVIVYAGYETLSGDENQ